MLQLQNSDLHLIVRSMDLDAAKGGAPDNPDWYRNLIAAGEATVEVATSTFQVAITELTGDERDRVFADQVKRMPGFGDFGSPI